MTSIRKGIKKALPFETKPSQLRAEVDGFERTYSEPSSQSAGEFPTNQLQLPAWLEEFESEPFQGFTEFDEVGQPDTELDFWLPPWMRKEPFHSYAELDEMEFDPESAHDSSRYGRDPYAPSEETGMQQMIETGKISQHCVTLWDAFCKAAKEWRRTASAVENKKWVIHHEEFKLNKWRCADQSIRRPDTVKRICKEVSDKVARLKAELSVVEAAHQQSVTAYRDVVSRFANECSKINQNTLVCPG